jgi:hypothetical protein
MIIDTFLKHQTISRRCVNEDAYITAKTYLLKTSHYGDISLYEIYIRMIFSSLISFRYDHLAFIVANAIQNPQDNTSKTKEFYFT